MHILTLHETFVWQINKDGYAIMEKYRQEIAESNADLPGLKI